MQCSECTVLYWTNDVSTQTVYGKNVIQTFSGQFTAAYSQFVCSLLFFFVKHGSPVVETCGQLPSLPIPKSGPESDGFHKLCSKRWWPGVFVYNWKIWQLI